MMAEVDRFVEGVIVVVIVADPNRLAGTRHCLRVSAVVSVGHSAEVAACQVSQNRYRSHSFDSAVRRSVGRLEEETHHRCLTGLLPVAA